MAVPTRAARQRLERPLLTLLLSVVIAASLGVVVYLVTATLPYLASSPTTDPNFGNQAQCLMTALPSERIGFCAFGSQALAYSGNRLARCGERGPAEVLEVSGVTHASFDWTGAVWYSRRSEPDQPPELWRLAEGRRERIAQVAPVGLVGTAFGVVSLDASGRLVAIDSERAVLGTASLPAAPPAQVQLTVSADGQRVALVTSGGLFVYDARRLTPLLGEAPCAVEFLWWRTEGHRALLACGPEASWALELDVDTGAREAAPKRSRTPSVLVPQRGLYVQECEQLPCTATAP